MRKVALTTQTSVAWLSGKWLCDQTALPCVSTHMTVLLAVFPTYARAKWHAAVPEKSCVSCYRQLFPQMTIMIWHSSALCSSPSWPCRLNASALNFLCSVAEAKVNIQSKPSCQKVDHSACHLRFILVVPAIMLPLELVNFCCLKIPTFRSHMHQHISVTHKWVSSLESFRPQPWSYWTSKVGMLPTRP